MNCDLKWASAFVLIVSFSLKLRTILGHWGNTLLTAFKLELFTLMNVLYLNIVQAALCLYSTLFIISRLKLMKINQHSRMKKIIKESDFKKWNVLSCFPEWNKMKECLVWCRFFHLRVLFVCVGWICGSLTQLPSMVDTLPYFDPLECTFAFLFPQSFKLTLTSCSIVSFIHSCIHS